MVTQKNMKRETFTVHLSPPTRLKNLSGVKNWRYRDDAYEELFGENKGETIVVKKVWCISKVEMREGAAGCPQTNLQITFWTRKFMRAGTCHPLFYALRFIAAARIIQRLLGLGLSQLVLLQLRRWCLKRPYRTYEHPQTIPSDLYYITIDCVSVFCAVIDAIGDKYWIEYGLFLLRRWSMTSLTLSV